MEQLEEPLSLVETRSVLENAKVPRPDGFMVKFCKIFEDKLLPILCQGPTSFYILSGFYITYIEKG